MEESARCSVAVPLVEWRELIFIMNVRRLRARNKHEPEDSDLQAKSSAEQMRKVTNAKSKNPFHILHTESTVCNRCTKSPSEV